MFRTALLTAVLLAEPLAARSRTISVTDGWSRATAPRAQIGAGYLTIRNSARAPDRLVAATSPRAARVEFHTMSMAGGVMRMRPLTNGLAIAPGAAVRLAPGGRHLMLVGLTSPLVAGERVPVTLRFQRGGAVTVQLRVAAAVAANASRH